MRTSRVFKTLELDKVDKVSSECNAVCNAYSFLLTANDIKWPHSAYDCTGPMLRLYSWLLSSDLSSKQFGPRRCHACLAMPLSPGRNKIKRWESLVCLKCARQNTCTSAGKEINEENGHFWCQRFFLSSFQFQAKDRRSCSNKAWVAWQAKKKSLWPLL